MVHPTFFVNLTKKEYTEGPRSDNQYNDLGNLFALFRSGRWSIFDRIIYASEELEKRELAGVDPMTIVKVEFDGNRFNSYSSQVLDYDIIVNK